MENPDPSIAHLPIRRLCQTVAHPQPVIVPLTNSNTLEVNIDAPPKYSPPPSYGKAVGLRVAKALRNSIRRSVRRFRRNNEPSVNSIESNNQNIPTISLSVEPAFAQSLRLNTQAVNRNLNEFIRSTIHGSHRDSQSSENLMLSDISSNDATENQNQSTSRNTAMGNLV